MLFRRDLKTIFQNKFEYFKQQSGFFNHKGQKEAIELQIIGIYGKAIEFVK